MDATSPLLLHIRQDPPPAPAPAPGAPQGGSTTGDEFLKLLQDPFRSVFQERAFWAALGSSLGVAVVTTLLFSLLRPYHSTVYAPKLKFADGKHAPPPVGKGLFAWITPVLKTREPYLAERIGLDAIVFLRFTRMCRNMFLVMSVIGLAVLIPANVAGRPKGQTGTYSNLTLITPLLVWGGPLWAQVICSWLFDALIAVFLWWNYRVVTRLRRTYLDSPDYQAALHSRTLMVTEIPKLYQSDDGMGRVIEEARPTPRPLHCSIARNVKDLPKLKSQHDEVNSRLETCVIKYLTKMRKNPNAPRPMCSPLKDDKSYTKGQKVDAIAYLADKKLSLKYEIMIVRDTLDKRDALPYGFASYNSVPEAHAVAYGVRRQHPQGSDIVLAPRPNDIIWDNLPLSNRTRLWRRFTNGLWVALLTVVYIVPNALMAVFLTNLANLGNVWPAFQTQLSGHPKWWAAVQGIASPAITSLLYVLLPMAFRRLATRAGKTSKTARDQQVVHQLFAFFVFNNLVVFTAFSTVWAFIAAIVKAGKGHENLWDTIKESQIGGNLAAALCNTSPYWVTWLLQRNLGAAIDLSQIWNLIWIWFSKTFRNPTPRQMIEWTRPPPFDYASYYNYFLFYSTITLCFATLQPIVLLVTALYFAFDSWLKKYLLMYVFVTKTESGGQFWRILFNRMVFSAILANITVIIFVVTKQEYTMAWAMVPAPLLMLAFKWYCWRTFDDSINYHNRTLSDGEDLMVPSKNKARHDKLGFRFGHPALTEVLRNPLMKEGDAQAFHEITRNRFLEDADAGTGAGVDGIPMHDLSHTHRGKSAPTRNAANFELVSENHLDFMYFKDRPEFADEHGRGELYGRPTDLVSERSGTPHSFMTGGGAPPSFRHYDSPSSSRASSPGAAPYGRVPTTTSYKDDELGHHGPGYQNHPAFRQAGGHSRSPHGSSGSRSLSRGYVDLAEPANRRGLYTEHSNESESALLRSTAETPREGSVDRWGRNDSVYSPEYGGVPVQDPSIEDTAISYDFYRGRRG
ncbi:MAG: Transmembrane protein 63C [Sclerophora amabilis]|nr:MAG: Transmembrane protein 63C [Sclerophora amabilis]